MYQAAIVGLMFLRHSYRSYLVGRSLDRSIGPNHLPRRLAPTGCGYEAPGQAQRGKLQVPVGRGGRHGHGLRI